MCVVCVVVHSVCGVCASEWCLYVCVVLMYMYLCIVCVVSALVVCILDECETLCVGEP